MLIAVQSFRHTNSLQCQFIEGTYECKKLEKKTLEQFALPINACIVHPCHHCVRGLQTFLLDSARSTLIEPENFLLRSTNITSKGSSVFVCQFQNKTDCHCIDTPCKGDKLFCSKYPCSESSMCNCRMTHQKTELIHISEEKTLLNPLRIQLEICLFDKTASNEKLTLHRRLLEHEKAVFSDHNMTFTFEDPVLKLPDIGKVIVRTDDFQTIYTVPEDLKITLPFELLAQKTTLRFTYLNMQGHTLDGEVHITGKSLCQMRTCYLCLDFFKHLKCYPPSLSYILYPLCLFCVISILWCLKTLVKSLLCIFQIVFYAFYGLFKIMKLLARFSLLFGSYLGTMINSIFRTFYQFLEEHGARGAQLQLHQIVIFSIFLQINLAATDCNTQAVVKSDLKSCESYADGSKMCQLFSTAEITLPTIASETCILFMDKKEEHLFTMKIKLDAVKCSFHTKRQYFTFPVTAKHISQISCIYNEFCGRGKHCIKENVGKKGLNFEAETPESREYPGKSSCLQGGLGSGCFVLTRPSCSFYRVFYVPDLIYSYEVSQITGHTCAYHVSVTHIENNTLSRIVLTDSAYTDTGVKVTVLGAYDQPQIHLSDYFIHRVGRQTEGYIAPACKRNIPKAGEIGAVQANQSFTKDFIFDPNLSVCDFFEDRLRCNTARDPLIELRKSQEFALPMERDMHLFHIQDGKLMSSLLISSAVRLQLHFQNYKISTKMVTVCPIIDDTPFEITGCYQCLILARIIFSAHSTCQAGVAVITFQEINVHSKAVRLSTDPTSHTIKFAGEKKCYKEKICLRAQTQVQCKQLDFCLEEPTVELLNLNTNYTIQTSVSTNDKWWSWIDIPSLGSSLFMLKLLGSSLFIICILITTFSTLITCCCRQR